MLEMKVWSILWRSYRLKVFPFRRLRDTPEAAVCFPLKFMLIYFKWELPPLADMSSKFCCGLIIPGKFFDSYLVYCDIWSAEFSDIDGFPMKLGKPSFYFPKLRDPFGVVMGLVPSLVAVGVKSLSKI